MTERNTALVPLKGRIQESIGKLVSRITKDADDIAASVLPALEESRKISITNEASYTEAMESCKVLTSYIDKNADVFDDWRDLFHKFHKAFISGKSKYELPLIQERGRLDSEGKAWRRKKEEEQAAAERKLAEAAAKELDEIRLKEAVALTDQGRHAEAEAIISEPAPPVFVKLPPAVPKVSGLSERTDWKARLIGKNDQELEESKMALIKAVAEGKVVSVALEVNLKYLNNQAHDLKDLMNKSAKIPGVEAYKETVVVRRRA